MANFGMLGALPPGLAGFVAAENQRGQQQAQQMQMLGSLSQLQNSQLEREMLPLKMGQLRAQVEEAKRMGGILQQFQAAQGGVVGAAPNYRTEGGMSPIGGAPAPSPGNPMQLPPEVALALLHPKLAPLGKVQAESFKPTDKMREAFALGLRPGTEQYNAFIGDTATQGGIWRTGLNGERTLVPGYAEGQGAIRGAEEAARAPYQFDNFTIGGRPYRMSVADYRTLTGPVTNEQQARAAHDVAVRHGIQFRATVSPGGQQSTFEAPQAAPVQIPATRPPIAPGAAAPGQGPVSAVAPAINTSRVMPSLGGHTEGEKATNVAFGKELGEIGGVTLKGGDTARNQLTSIAAMRQALQQVKEAGGTTGAFAPMVQRATEFAQGFGINPASLGLPKDAGPYQVMDAITNKLAMAMIGPGGMPANNFSEADRNFVVATNARKADTEQGFLAKLDVAEKVARRTEEAESSLLGALEQGKTVGQWRMEWSRYVNQNPLFKKTDVDAAIRDARPSKILNTLPPANTTKGMRVRDTQTGDILESTGMSWRTVPR